MSIGKWSVDNPVLLNILMVAIIILGGFSITRLPREQFSEVPFFWVTILVPYPGVSAADVEKSITVPIENEMDGLTKIKQISSLTREGISYVQVEFDDGISKEQFARLYQEVQTRFNKVVLPEGILDPEIDDFSSSDFLPVIEVFLYGTGDKVKLNKSALRLKELLLSVPEVEQVTLTGDRNRQFRIEVDQRRIEARGISLNDISRTIQNRVGSIPGGTLETPSREYLVRTFGEIDNVNELAQLIIRRNADGSIIRLGDMAACHDTLDPKAALVRYNGKQAISLQISKVVGGNSIDVVDKVKEVVEQYRTDLPEDYEISFFNDSTIRIRSSISVLVTNAISGFILLVIILWLFLGVKNAFIAALGIPVAFSMTFIILELLGETLNSNSLFGLVLVLGLVVDHAIVIVENSYRLQATGLSKRKAAIAATDEVVWPVFSATLTTIAAFLPLMILPGILGRFFRVIPLVVSIALVVSTIEAFTFLPLHFVEWGSQHSKKGSWFSHIEKWFSIVFIKLLSVKYYVVSGAFVLSIVIFSLLGQIRQDLFSGEDYTYFFIDIELPVGTPRTKTNTFVNRFEEIILATAEKGEVKSVSTVIGRSSAGGPLVTQNNVAQITVDLYELNAGRTRPISAVIDEIKNECSTIPGAESVRFRRVRGGPPVDPPVSIRFFGDNYEDLQAIAGKMKNKLQQYPELYNIKDNLEKGTPELRVVVDQEKAVKYGLTSSIIGLYLRAGFDGFIATRIFDDNENIDVIVQYRGGDITSVNQMMQMKIPTPKGDQISLSALCSVQEEPVISTIKRVEGKREVTITAEAWDKKNIRTINKECQDVYEWEIKPTYRNIEFKAGGEFAEFSNILFQILRLFLIGLFIIYLLLGSQFKSYIQPFLILITLPFTFAGVVLFLIISGTPFSTTVLYAGVALAGVAVNDSIVLISFMNDRKKQGTPIYEAIVQSVQIRLRPIVLTSVTTIAGLLPTALGIGGYSIVWGPMASTIIFGLMVSTITALVIIPLLYAVIEDFRNNVQLKR